MTEDQPATTIELATEIISAYVAKNSVPMAELPALIRSIHETLTKLGATPEPEAPPAELKPAVPVKKSVMHDHIVCLEDGKKFKSLKRHLHAEHGMTPQDYRTRWGLDKSYPMVAPEYANARSALAKTLGLGRKAGSAEIDEAMEEPVDEVKAPEPTPAPKVEAFEPESVAEKPKRGRKAKEPA